LKALAMKVGFLNGRKGRKIGLGEGEGEGSVYLTPNLTNRHFQHGRRFYSDGSKRNQAGNE